MPRSETVREPPRPPLRRVLVDLADLRPSGQCEADLRWYHNERDGELLKSNHGATVHQLEMGGPGGSRSNYEMDSRHLATARRAGPIEGALAILSEDHLTWIRYAYCDKVITDRFGHEAHEKLAVYGALAGLVVISPSALKGSQNSEKGLIEWLERIAKNARRFVAQGRLFQAITSEAEARLLESTRYYEAARRRSATGSGWERRGDG